MTIPPLEALAIGEPPMRTGVADGGLGSAYVELSTAILSVPTDIGVPDIWAWTPG